MTAQPDATGWSADRIGALATVLSGPAHGRIRRLAEALGVSYDTLRQVMSGRRPLPPGWVADLDRLQVTVSGSTVAPPPPAGPRQQACVQALAPHARRLLDQAVLAGWEQDEVLAALAEWRPA